MVVDDEPLPDDAGQLPALFVRAHPVRVQPVIDRHSGTERPVDREQGAGPRA